MCVCGLVCLFLNFCIFFYKGDKCGKLHLEVAVLVCEALEQEACCNLRCR